MQTTTAPSFIYWYKGKQLINYSQAGGAINVITDRQTRTSNLLIAKASPADNGNYTCSPSNSGKLDILFFYPIDLLLLVWFLVRNIIQLMNNQRGFIGLMRELD